MDMYYQAVKYQYFRTQNKTDLRCISFSTGMLLDDNFQTVLSQVMVKKM